MSIIPFIPESSYRYCVYEHKIDKHQELATYRMIVIKNQDNQILCFTGLEQFSFPYTGQKPQIKVRQKAELVYICNALNYIFAHTRVSRIADITADLVITFFDAYCNTPKAKSAEIMLTQQSMDNCVRHVTSFFANLASAYQTKMQVDELMVYEDTKPNKHSTRILRRYVPRYVPKRPHSRDIKQLRDMPIAAAQCLLDLAWVHDPMVAFGIALQIYAGLRPSCVTNIRQNTSPVSATQCLRFSYTGSSVSGLEIDLTHEYILRKDGVSVGRIKKERTVHVYKPFIPHLLEAYQLHMTLLSSKNCEQEYMPMFISAGGKAMTYNTYSNRVKRLVYDHPKPELEMSEDPLLSSFSHLLESHHWAPHALRHVFTEQLVLEGLDVAQIQFYRGDASPESALTYIANKGDIMRQIAGIHDQAIDSLAQYKRTRN